MNQTAEVYFRKGNSSASLRDYKGAIEFYDKAIKLKPGFVDAYKNRAFAKKLAGDFKGAEADLKKAANVEKLGM